MATIRLKASQVGRELRARDRKVRRAVNRGVREAAHAGRYTLVRATNEADLVYRGQFKNSWQVRRARRRHGFQDWHLENDAPHAGIIERGARPHPVSPEGRAAIMEWVARKVLGMRMSKQMRAFVESGGTAKPWRRSPTRRTREKLQQLQAITWGIVRKLNREGQEGRFIVRDNLGNLHEILLRMVERRIVAQAAGQAGRGR